jgi:hypothetical protein
MSRPGARSIRMFVFGVRGCTIYACLVGKSHFWEKSGEMGCSLSMFVLGEDRRRPGEGVEMAITTTNCGRARGSEEIFAG